MTNETVQDAKTKIILSASRRTDIPAFYLDWFLERLECGYFETVNPFNRKTRLVPAGPEQVHSIVFWSKNYGRFLDNSVGEKLQDRGYHLLFNFTVNSGCPRLEPNIPELATRLEQMKSLAQRFGARRLLWRFDPVCFFRDRHGRNETNLADFPRIAEFAAGCGIQRCVTSMLDLYPKVLQRPGGPAFYDPPRSQKRRVLLKQERVLSRYGIQLQACCEKELLDGLPPDSAIQTGACIPGELLVALSGSDAISLRKDAGQRRGQGCGCTVSVDVGDYRSQPCGHGCRYCYANPAGCA